MRYLRLLRSAIKKKRYEEGLSVEALATELGLDQELLRAYEAGRNTLSKEDLKQIAKRLHVEKQYNVAFPPPDKAGRKPYTFAPSIQVSIKTRLKAVLRIIQDYKRMSISELSLETSVDMETLETILNGNVYNTRIVKLIAIALMDCCEVKTVKGLFEIAQNHKPANSDIDLTYDPRVEHILNDGRVKPREFGK